MEYKTTTETGTLKSSKRRTGTPIRQEALQPKRLEVHGTEQKSPFALSGTKVEGREDRLLRCLKNQTCSRRGNKVALVMETTTLST